MTICLQVEQGTPNGHTFVLHEGENTLGRSRSATCRLEAADVSGLHARIQVARGTATLENLSRFGTVVDDVVATAPVTLSNGQRIAIGKETRLRVCTREEASTTGAAPRRPADGDTRATGDGAVTGTTRDDALLSRQPATGATPSPIGLAATMAVADASDLTQGLPLSELTQDGGTVEGLTRAMQTRAATPEEIEHLRQVEQKRHKRRLMQGLAILVPLLVLVILFRPRTPPPEPNISWPKDADGNYLDLFEPGPSGSLAEGGYDLCYPGPTPFEKRVTADGMQLSGWIGRERNVPMRILVQERIDPHIAALSREAFVEEWIQEQKSGSERWSFDKPSLLPGFVGLRNGLPYIRVTYYRDADGSWFGVASLFRHGYRRIVIRAEAPALERVRVEDLLSSRFMRASAALEYGYWEPPAALPGGDAAMLLKQAETDLNRMAPATWADVQQTLAGVLAGSVRNGNTAQETQALQLLVTLRERQALWFNSQQLAFDAACMQNNRTKAREIARFTKAVFNDVEDQRYYRVRKWNTEF